MTLTVLRHGIDTLEASIGGALLPSAARALEAAKTKAQATDTPQGINLGLDFAVQAQGAKPYRYKLTGDEVTIRLTDAEKLPGASIRLSPLGLALYEPLDLYNLTTELVAEVFGPGGPHKLSRIDVAADFQGFDPAGPHGARFVCRSPFRPVYPSIDDPATFQFGRGDIVVRVYNKTREIAESSHKTWLPLMWAQHPGYDPSADVWRFEVQMRRDAIRQTGRSDPESGIEDMAAFLSYGLSWADLRIPQGESSDRWPRHPAWDALDAAAGAHTTLTREELESELARLDHIASAVAGYAISAGAKLDVTDPGEVWAILGAKVRNRLGPAEQFAGAVRARQLERLGKGDAA